MQMKKKVLFFHAEQKSVWSRPKYNLTERPKKTKKPGAIPVTCLKSNAKLIPKQTKIGSF